MSEETIECRADLCGREAHLEGKDWYFCKCGWSGSSYDEVAELSAQVERLREELDRQMEYIEWLEEFAPKAGEYNTSWDAYELAMGIHWTQMEDEEE